MACKSLGGCPQLEDFLCKPLPPLTDDENPIIEFLWDQGPNKNPCPLPEFLPEIFTEDEELMQIYMFLLGCMSGLPPLSEDEELPPWSPTPPEAPPGPPPPTSELTLDCGNAFIEGGEGSCTFDCDTGSLVLNASGGTPPYFWSITGNGILTQSGTFNSVATIIPPPTNPNLSPNIRAVAIRFVVPCFQPDIVDNPVITVSGCKELNCVGDVLPFKPPCAGGNEPCGASGFDAGSCQLCGNNIRNCTDCPWFEMEQPTGCETFQITIPTCTRDLRTALQISQGCAPCDVEMAGSIVTLTDFNGTSISITLYSAIP